MNSNILAEVDRQVREARELAVRSRRRARRAAAIEIVVAGLAAVYGIGWPIFVVDQLAAEPVTAGRVAIIAFAVGSGMVVVLVAVVAITSTVATFRRRSR